MPRPGRRADSAGDRPIMSSAATAEGDAAADGRGPARGRLARRDAWRRPTSATSSIPRRSRETHALAERLARTMRARLVRRERARRRGRRLDLRRTIHRSVSHGGTPIELVWRRRKIKPLRLVVLLDASGSMSLYTAFFVRFLHGVVDAFREAEAFVFHTRLAHVSRQLRDRDVARAVDRLSLMAQGIGGGTRIGESLATFNRWHATRVINSRTAVMIVSDGYDTGEPERLGAEMRAAAPALPAHRLAQPADRLARLCAGGARHAGGAALCRSVRAGAQSREPRRARALSREDLMAMDQRDRHPRSASRP